MNLEQAIENLYTAFANVPKPQSITHQRYELQPDEVQQLLERPLRELSPDLLRSYLFNAVYTVGTWDDFRYFLPRLLEVAVTETEQVDLEEVTRRIHFGQSSGGTLSAAQRDALHAFAWAYWQDLLATPPTAIAVPPETIIEFEILQPLGLSRAQLLADWRKHPLGAWHLAVRLQWPQSPPFPETWRRVDLIAWLESALFADPDGPAAQDISNALLYLGASP